MTPGFTPGFGESITCCSSLGSLLALVSPSHVAHLFSFLCCVVFCVFCLSCPVSCVHNVDSVSEEYILDCHFGFLKMSVWKCFYLHRYLICSS
jgi:hypothetical protein